MSAKLKLSLVVICLFSNLIFAAGGVLPGTGTAADPYLIEDFEDFDTFAGNTDYWAEGVHIKLMTDVDLSSNLPGRVIYENAPIAGDTDNDSSFDGTAYFGFFDGNGHTISKLTIYRDLFEELPHYSGLFGYIGLEGSVSNLNLENFVVEGQSPSGGLCGANYGNISACDLSGSVSGPLPYYTGERIGGLCGINYGTIDFCKVSASVSGTDTSLIGGFCASNRGSINSCCFTGLVSGEYSVGGFCAGNIGNITACYANGTVTGDFTGVGGFCVANSGNITACYATGSVDGFEGVCGFCSNNSGRITACYANGTVTGEFDLYGLCSEGTSGVTSSFYNTETSGIPDPEAGAADTNGMVGISTAEMQDINTFLNAGWDFTGETANGTEDIWFMNGYPELCWSNVDVFDLTELSDLTTTWLANSCNYGTECYYFDYNNDSMIDIADFAYLAANWLEPITIKEPPKLIAHWQLDEVGGTVAVDSSIYGNDGTLFGDPSWTAGISGNCLQFDGENDFVEVSDSGIFDFSDQITISLWAKLNDVNSSCSKIIVKPSDTSGADPWEVFAIDLGSSGVTPRFILSEGNAGSWNGAYGTDLQLNIDQWYHIAGTYDGSVMKLYLDGVLVATNSTSISIGTSDISLRIGKYIDGHFFDGAIDEVKIFNSALSASGIADLAVVPE